MTAEEFRYLAKTYYQNRTDWLAKIAADLGVHPRTVRRWAEDECPITERVERHIRLLCEGTKAVVK